MPRLKNVSLGIDLVRNYFQTMTKSKRCLCGLDSTQHVHQEFSQFVFLWYEGLVIIQKQEIAKMHLD